MLEQSKVDTFFLHPFWQMIDPKYRKRPSISPVLVVLEVAGVVRLHDLLCSVSEHKVMNFFFLCLF